MPRLGPAQVARWSAVGTQRRFGVSVYLAITMDTPFADELFRACCREHPGVHLLPLGMVPRVAAMAASAG